MGTHLNELMDQIQEVTMEKNSAIYKLKIATQCIQYFIDRCDEGSIRSSVTLAKYRKALKDICELD